MKSDLLRYRKRVASTHGNHNVYVTDLRTGKNIQTLTGHPRTPWCIAFHPSSNQILATGCLGGQVRVWDLHVSFQKYLKGVLKKLLCVRSEVFSINQCFYGYSDYSWKFEE